MKNFKKFFSIPAGWLPHIVRIGLGLGVVCLFLLHSNHVVKLPLLDSAEGSLYDWRLRATMPADTYDKVVIIDIDEKSLKEEGRWPWGRERMGDLVRKLTDRYKVKVVGMDVVFAEPESQYSMKIIERLSRNEEVQSKEMRMLLNRLQPLLDGDQAFAKKMRGRDVVLGYYFKQEGHMEEGIQAGKLPPPACDLAQAAEQGMQPKMASGYGANLPLLQDAAAGGGHFIPNVDADGIIRSIPLLMSYQGKCYEALSLAILRRMQNAPQVIVEQSSDAWSKFNLHVGDLQIPVTASASALIPYRGHQGSFRYVSAVDVLKERVEFRKLEGTVALLGTSAAGLLDLRATPVGSAYAGVEAHANMIAGMLEGEVKKTPSAIAGMESWLLLVLGLIVSVLLGRAAPMQVMWLALAASALLTIANLMLWIGPSVVMPLASPLLLIGALFVLN
ncbi:MAG: CHASE2 domain-containing protein, partial [Gallionellaceae bacterium]